MWEPFGVANTTSHWRSGPNERGTLNILSTCLITLILCIYSCLHLHIPSSVEKSFTQRAKRKSLWLIAGLFAPEFVAFCAYFEWHSARSLSRQMQKTLDPLVRNPKLHDSVNSQGDANSASIEHGLEHQQSRTGTIKQHRWTRTHSHYALMGGYVFDVSHSHVEFAPCNAQRLTLSPIALRFLAQHHPQLIPDISEEDIKDKSKADNFTKSIVCVQATWFLAQIIGRLATQYPISLLELNTFLHAICCLLIYVAWWHKPLDIEQPALIDVAKEGIEELCAFMIMQSKISQPQQIYLGQKTKRHRLIPRLTYPKKNVYEYARDAALKHIKKSAHPETINPNALDAPWSPRNGTGPRTMRIYYGQSCFGYCFSVTEGERNQDLGNLDLNLVSILCSTADIKCLQLSQQHIRRTFGSDPLPDDYASGDQLLYRAVGVFHDDETVLEAPPNSFHWLRSLFEDNYDDFDSSFLIVVFAAGVTAAGTVYGGIHLIAWNSQFPSLVEKYFWRASCLIIAAPFPMLMTYMICLIARYWSAPSRRVVVNHFEAVWLLRYLLVILKFIFGTVLGHRLVLLTLSPLFTLLYISARVYLVVESFINLAHLPDGAYQEPKWNFESQTILNIAFSTS